MGAVSVSVCTGKCVMSERKYSSDCLPFITLVVNEAFELNQVDSLESPFESSLLLQLHSFKRKFVNCIRHTNWLI